VQFLHFFENTTDLRRLPVDLLDALVSLGDGHVVPLLERCKRPSGGRAPASAARESDIAMAAVTAHRLCETGMEPEEAYKMVAKVCREAGFKRSRKGKSPDLEVTARTVSGWCEEIAADVGRYSQIAKAFDLAISRFPATEDIKQAIARKGDEAVRKGLLEGLRRALAERGSSDKSS